MDAAHINAVSSLVPPELAERGSSDVAAVGASCRAVAGVTGMPPQGARDPALPAAQERWAKLRAELAPQGLELNPTRFGIYIVKRSHTTFMPDTLIHNDEYAPPEGASL